MFSSCGIKYFDCLYVTHICGATVTFLYRLENDFQPLTKEFDCTEGKFKGERGCNVEYPTNFCTQVLHMLFVTYDELFNY